MSKAIWKFRMEVADEQTILMPIDANIIHVAVQFDAPCLWAIVDPTMEKQPYTIHMFGTGHKMPDDPGKFIGTFMINDGDLVFHAFVAVVR